MKRCQRYLVTAIIMLFVLDIHGARAQYYKVRAEKENKEYTADKKEKTQEQDEAARVNNKICPVDFKSLYEARQKGLKELFLYTYEGKTYDFDSPACVEKFKKGPQGYLEEWEKKERSRRINVIND